MNDTNNTGTNQNDTNQNKGADSGSGYVPPATKQSESDVNSGPNAGEANEQDSADDNDNEQ